MPVVILSRREVESRVFEDGDYVISITDPDSPLAKINGTNDILRLQFYDIDTPLKTLDNKIFYPMQMSDAIKIVQFIKSIKLKKLKNIVVHCEAGLSRSAGIGAGIAKYLYDNDNHIWNTKTPNYHCYKILLKAFYENEQDTKQKSRL